MAEVTVCKNNLKQIGTTSFIICDDYDGTFLSAGWGKVPITFNAREYGILQDYSLAAKGNTRKMNDVWSCPGRDFETVQPDEYGQWIHSYMYFGGIGTWKNPTGQYASSSPVRLQSAEPGWALAADATMKVDQEWGGGRKSAFGDMPAHKSEEGTPPPAANHLYVDGSVQWIDFYQLYHFHTWSQRRRIPYWYQEDFGDIEQAELKNLEAKP